MELQLIESAAVATKARMAINFVQPLRLLLLSRRIVVLFISVVLNTIGVESGAALLQTGRRCAFMWRLAPYAGYG
jgi:hypothetical protein